MGDPSLALDGTPPRPARKRRLLRLLVKTLVVVLLLVGLAPLALGLGFVRDALANKASAAVGAPVSIGGASAWWWSGIDLTDVVVGSPPGHDGPLARVERVHVKVGLGGLLSGDVDADVTVTKPVVTLRRNAAQRWNTQDLAPAKQPSRDRPAASGARAGPRLALQVIDGVLEAHGVSAQVERIRDIDLAAQLDPDGALSATLGLLAEKAGLGGKDAQITLEGAHQPGQASPIEARVPALDLARLAGLIEGATGLRGVAGTSSVEAKGTFDDAGHATGTFKLGGSDLQATLPDGTRITLGRLAGTVDGATQGPEGALRTRGTLKLTGSGLDAVTAGGTRVTLAQVEATIDGSHQAGARAASATADVRLDASGLAAVTSSGSRLTLARVEGTLSGGQGEAGEDAKGDLVLTGLEVLGGAGVQAPTLRESEVRARFEAARATDGRITLAALDVAAGQALRLRATTPLSILPGDAGTAQVSGDAEVQADLGKIAALKALVPALESLETGALSASLRARPGPGLDIALGARLTNLVLAPGELVAQGYRDPDITLQAGAQRSPEGALSVQVYALTSAIARLKAAQPFVMRRAADGGVSFAGPLDLALDLGALGRAFGTSLGLLAGESLAGELTVTGNATGEPDAGRLDAEVRGARIVLPPSWSANRAAATLQGRLGLAWTRQGLEAQVTGLEGLGLAASGKASLAKQGETLGLTAAEAQVGADLAQLRAWFGPRLGLEPAATLAGRAQGTLRLTEQAGVRRLEGRLKVASLAYRATPEGALLEEPALSLEHVVLLPRDAGPTRLETFRLAGNGYQLDLAGSSVGGAEGAFDVRGTLSGDAAQIAARLRPLLGEGMQDLEGRGAVEGRIALANRGGPALEGTTLGADLTLGTWSFSGARLEATRLNVQRTGPGTPYDARLTTTLNGGSASLVLALRPQGERLPWTLATRLAGVDTSTWITSGAGFRRLAYVLPTLVPTGSKVPVLSGRLDASVDLAAADLTGPDLAPSLAGSGTLALTQGSLTQSTLFGALGGADGRGLGDVGRVLTQVAPEAGKALAGLVRATAFQEVTSRFEVASERVQVKEARLLAQEHRIDMAGVVTFAQQADLAVRLWMGSKAGEELKRVLPDQTIPLRVRGPLEKPQVVPDLQASDLLKGALPKPTDVLKDPSKALDEVKKLKDRWKELLPR